MLASVNSDALIYAETNSRRFHQNVNFGVPKMVAAHHFLFVLEESNLVKKDIEIQAGFEPGSSEF